MIFAAFGTAPIPFPRFAEALDLLAGQIDEPVVVQYGHTEYPFKHADAHAFLDQETMARHLREATVVVTHGGWGTISECLKLQKPVVAVPRRMGPEHNHEQEQVVSALEAMNALLAVRDCTRLAEVVEQARTHTFSYPPRGDAAGVINDFLTRTFSS